MRGKCADNHQTVQRHDNQYNGTQNNDIQRKTITIGLTMTLDIYETQHNVIKSVSFLLLC